MEKTIDIKKTVSADVTLATEKEGRLIARYAVPCVISLLVGALYNIVDQIYIGHSIGYLGNGATNVVFPLTVIALAVATMIGDGTCALASMCLGKGERESASRAVGCAIEPLVTSSVVVTAVYALFGDGLLHLFGATEANISYAKEYFGVIVLGIPVYMFGQGLNAVIRCDGSPRFAMAATLAGAVANIILDPIFIFDFALGLGMKGAAIATVAGQLITALLSLIYICRTKLIKLSRTSFSPNVGTAGRIFVLGTTSFLTQVSMVVAMAATNNMAVKYGALSVYGADIPLAVIGNVSKVLQIVLSVVIGIAAGCIPVVGYNHGAQNYGRMRKIMKLFFLSEAVVGFAALIVVQLFPETVNSIFGQENALYTEFAVRTLRIYLSVLPLTCLNKAAFIFLQSVGMPGFSNVLSLVREIILGAGLACILPVFFGLNGILVSLPAADLITFVVCAAVILRFAKKLNAKANEVRD